MTEGSPRDANPTSEPSRVHRAPSTSLPDANDAPTNEAAQRSSTPRRKPQSAPDPGFVAVGRVLGPFGLHGEVKVQSLSDNPRRWARGSELFAGTTAVKIAESREAGGYVYLRFRGYPDRTSVESLRHALLQVREADLPPLPPGEYYRFELLGLLAIDREGAELGTVAEIIETGANDVLRVTSAGAKDLLVPLLTDTLISVEIDAHRIVLDPPDWR